MVNKELIKQLIITFQESLPRNVIKRDIEIPIDTEKIITVPGVRRCGKSTLFLLTINNLLQNGVNKNRILYINFDDDRLLFEQGENDKIINAYRELFPDIAMNDVYIFFDEIQELPDWAKFVRRVYDQETKKLFVTGSNAHLLSSEIATSLRGRTLQYETFPLSFKEFCRFKNIDTNFYNASSKSIIVNSLNEYLIYGGFPEIALCKSEQRLEILQNYYFTMIYKDLCERYQIRNVQKVKYFNRRIMTNISKPTSIHKIVNEIRSHGEKFSKDSGYEFASYTEAIYLFFALTRFETSYIREISSDKKYYCVDTGLFAALLSSDYFDKGKLLENAIFIWLYKQRTPLRELHFLQGDSNCDFVWIENQKITEAIQVAWDISDENTFRREISAFKNINCNRCFIITADEERDINEFGKIIHILPAWKLFLS